ncbi:T7SS effector LXG polymorphic toxin [Metabacillus elymi]|uniref:EndoU domain-containing protein n=1 Tax=Metabacillus elymi TaxID=2745198 RepID=A0ABX6S7A2_9BACI|nr:T7SS effector LXG polymorphic toxin [Metabacillus sp. KUDC1714]QNF30000.1 EndoU domain-containing protein [Metabacillus sp. KUDC1714]
MKVLDTKSFIHTMKDRSQGYKNLREQLEQVKRKCNDIVNLDDQFQGKGADAIKNFYQAQIDVIEAWLRLTDRHIVFFNGIQGSTEDKDLSGNTVVHLPFLEDELAHHIRNQKDMVASQQDELQRIFNGIDDLIPLNPYSTNSFEDHIEKADKDRKDTIDAVYQLDQDLTSEYKLSEGDEQYVITLFQQLIEASRQGNTISPIHFNSAAYKASDVYQLKAQAEQQTINYLAYKKNQEEVRKKQAEIEAEIEAREREKAEFAKLNPIEKTVHSFKEIGNDFWDGLEARNAKKFDSVYDFGNYLTIGSFDTAKTMYQGMEDRAHVAMNSPYDFVNYISMGTLDLGNGAINPEESFSKEHWLSSIGLASILAGGAKPIVRAPKTPSLQDRNLVLEKTIDKAHELTTKTKSQVNYVVGEVRGGIYVLLNEMNDHNNLAYSLIGEGTKIPFKVMDTEAVKKVFDRVLSKFSFSGVGISDGKYTTGTMKHIYHGEINRHGKAVGYHHESMMGGKIIPGSESIPDKNGVYKAKVEINGIRKKATSSFFPKEWDRVQVLVAIEDAFNNKKQIGPNKYLGISSTGIKIEMYLNKDGTIATAYPLYKK